MRVFFVNGSVVKYSTATHWESCGTNWVELSTDENEIVVILNWDQVIRIEILSS